MKLTHYNYKASVFLNYLHFLLFIMMFKLFSERRTGPQKPRSIMSQRSSYPMISGSEYYSMKHVMAGTKTHKFTSGVFKGKSLTDHEAAAVWSPTYPLRSWNPFGVFSSSRSMGNGKGKSKDSGKVGLSIVDSLLDDDHINDSSRIVLPSLATKRLSSLRSGNYKFQKPYIPSQTFTKPYQPSAKPPLIPKTNVIAGLRRKMNSVVELVKSYAPIPKTTHFDGDKVLQSIEHKKKKKSIFEIVPLELTSPTKRLLPPSVFLRFCYYCRKNLDGEDIYMYSDDKAFCSDECRSKKIVLDEVMENEDEQQKAKMKMVEMMRSMNKQ